MPLFDSINYRVRFFAFISVFVSGLFFSLFSLAQINLAYHLLTGYLLSDDAPINKGKHTLFVFEQAATFEQVFKPTPDNKRHSTPNFTKDMVVGIALPSTTRPPKLSVSKVFVQDSILTVRYIRMTDTTLTHHPQSSSTHPILLIAIPKQTVLKTRLIENGRVVQTLKKREGA